MRFRHSVLYFVCPDTFNLYLSPPSSPSPYTHAHWKSIKCLLSDFLVEDVPWRHPERLSTSGWLQRGRRHSSSSRCVTVWTSRCSEKCESVFIHFEQSAVIYIEPWTATVAVQRKRCDNSAEAHWRQFQTKFIKKKKKKKIVLKAENTCADIVSWLSVWIYTITVNWHSSTGRKNPN